jgi:6-phosphogluconolactonase (cycloisomerase 2 family)
MKARLLSALCIIFCGLTGCVGGQRTFLYTAGPGTNEVFAFRVRTNGSITALGTPNFAAGSGPNSIAVHPPGDFVYITNVAGNTVTQLNINRGNGELTVPPTNSALPPLTPPNIFNTGAGPNVVVVAPNQPRAYILNQAGNDISAYLLDPSSGALILITNPPVPPPNSNPSPTYADGNFTAPSTMVISPKGDFIFVASPAQNSIFAFPVNNADGSLGAPAKLTLAATVAPTGLVVHPSGKFLYATDPANNSVLAFTIANGALTQVSGSPFNAGTAPTGIATDPAGAELFVSNATSNNVSVYAIDRNSGGLGQVAGSPFATGGRGPGFVLATGSFVFVADQVTNDISAFTINSNGTLTAVQGSPFSVPTTPTWIAAVVE